jgi:transposase
MANKPDLIPTCNQCYNLACLLASGDPVQEENITGRITRAASHLTPEEVKERMRNDPNPLYRQRWAIIYNALVDPREAKEIALITGVSVATIHKLIPLYNKIGVAAVETPGKGGSRNAYINFKEEENLLKTFFERAEKGEIVTASQIQPEYEKMVGHAVDPSTVHRMMKRHKWRKVVPRSQHPKANKQKQEEFKENFPQQVKEVEKTKDPKDDRPTLLMVQDEGKFGRVNIPRRAWAPEHVRPLVPRQIVREYVYAYAAIAPKLGKMTSLVLPHCNTEMMNLFLKQVSEDFSSYFIIMQVDGASWHGSQGLVLPENIRLIRQPPYSPELNPTEHIWEELRENYFSNRCYKSLDHVMKCLCDGLMELEANSQYLRSMTYFPHLRMAA